MCGIIGCIGRDDETLDILLDGLENLEYRGYDSTGVALGNGTLDVIKRAGTLDGLRAALDGQRPSGRWGIGHTRWSTHGPPTDTNAHPHVSEDGTVAVVHNGIIENYRSLREELSGQGVTFESDTDTEVIPHLIARELDRQSEPEQAVWTALERLAGSFAVVATIAGSEQLFAAREDSPLVLGIDDGARYIASDVPAFLDQTREVVYLEDGDAAILTPEDHHIADRNGDIVDRSVTTVDWTPEQTGKSGYEHYMRKEIAEQPRSLRQCLSGRVDELLGEVTLDDLPDLDVPDEVQLVAAGTSYHASLYTATLLRGRGVSASAHLASEYATDPSPATEDTLMVGVTQSGETADTLSALREAQSSGATTLALTNVVGSSAARECDHALYIRCGPEIGVAATKTFSAQLVASNFLVEHLLGTTDRDLLEALRDLPSSLQSVLDRSRATDVVDTFRGKPAFFFIGRGLSYPVALEGALKFKEITYEHAEGFAAGELKHGTLALVTEDTPVVAIVTGDDERARKTVNNVKEVEARGGPVIAVTDGRTEVGNDARHVLSIPETHPRVAPILATVQLQLLSYHMANALDRPIDKPRNLAKSVTVE